MTGDDDKTPVEMPERTLWLFVTVRADVPPEIQMVNVGHACSESVPKALAPLDKTTRLVLFHLPTEADLRGHLAVLEKKGVPLAAVWENDGPYAGQLMSIACEPTLLRSKLRKLHHHLPKARFADSAPDVQYIGLFLDEVSRGALLATFPAAHKQVHADHVTLVYNPSPEEIERLRPEFGAAVDIEIIGHAIDTKAQAILVAGVSSRNDHPHVTISTAPGVSAVYSNELLARGFVSVVGPTLRGVFDTFPRSTIVDEKR